MLKVDSSLNHIPAGVNHVIGLHESINQPLVNIPNYGTAPTGAYVMGTRNDQGAYTVFVYLHQAETRAVIIYVSEPRHLTHEQYRVEEAEALRFVESMGFMVDNLHFPTLAPPEQQSVMSRIPLFRPPPQTVDLYDVQEERPLSPPAIFGGLSPQDSALFRNPPPVQPNVASAASPYAGHAHVPSQHVPSQVGSQVGPPVLGTPEQPPHPTTNAMPYRQGNIVDGRRATGSTDVVSATPLSGQSSSRPAVSQRDPEALKRLGRLLGTFIWLVAAVAGPAACKSSGGANNPAASPRLTAQVDLGNQQLAQGRWPDAIKAFEKALDSDEDNFDALRGSALAYLRLGRLDEAERLYLRSLEVNPQASLSRNELAVVFLEQGRCQEAVPLLEKVLEDIFYPTPEFAEHNLARAYACLGQVSDALDRLDKVVTKRPYFCLGYLTLSRLASDARPIRPDVIIRACDDFAHYCEQNDKIRDQVLPQQSALCYLRKGLAYAELGDVESARSAFQRCQSLGDAGRECTKSLELLPQ